MWSSTFTRALSVLLLLVCIGTVRAETDGSVPFRSAVGNLANLQLASVNAAVGAVNGQEPLFLKHGEHVVPIASLTKLMTAVVVLDGGQPLDEWLTIVERGHAPPNNGYSRLRIGSRLTRGALLRIALMSSENLAAHELARHYRGGRAAFVNAMNAKARALGMHSTHFVGPSGLAPENRSTASDLLKLVKAAYRHAPIRDYTTTPYYTARFRHPRYSLDYGNTNALVRAGRWNIALSKTGYLDEAGRCLVMVTPVAGTPVAFVLLDSFGTRTPLGDAGRIREWLKTGDSGAIAGAARDYERRKSAALSPMNASN